MAQNITLMGASYSAVPAVTLPKTGGGTARFDDATITTATASDVASGKLFLAADGTITTGTNSGGGGSSWELVSSTELTTATSSTSATSAGTVSLGSGAFTKDDIIYVQVRDKEGKRASRFFGTDVIFVNSNKANGSTSTFTAPAMAVIRVNSSNNFVSYTGSYGVWGYSITSAGLLTIRQRYSSSYSYTIDSTYTVKVYKLTPPSGMVLFT